MTAEYAEIGADVRRWDEPIPGGVAHHVQFPDQTSLIASLGDVPRGSLVDCSWDTGSVSGATWLGIALSGQNATSVILDQVESSLLLAVPVESMRAVYVKKVEVVSYSVGAS